jgi:Na+-driven multidrug efflux pump
MHLSRDLDFEVSWLNRYNLWVLPYLLHAVLGLTFGFFFGWALGAAYWLGMMTHPIQGWLVNAFAHKYGGRNFETPDDSRNNGLVAALVIGTVMAAAVWGSRDALAVAGLNAEGQPDGARLAPMLAGLLAAGAVVTLFDGLQGVASMALRAREVVWPPTAIHVASYAIVMVPLCWWLALGAGPGRGQGVWGVLAGVAVASVLAGVLQALLLEWYARRDRSDTRS